VAVLVKVGIETDRGPWVAALAATGYEVFAIKSTMSAALRPMSEHPSDPDLTAMDQPRGTVRTPGSVDWSARRSLVIGPRLGRCRPPGR
jgi:hypothetical protein